MASLLAATGSALLNALTFSGSSFLFSMFSDHGAAERKRHDLALEALQKARDTWQKQRIKRLDFINERLRQEKQAEVYISDLDRGMRLYYEVTKQRLPPLMKEPTLSDFYHPSEGQKTAEVLFILGGLGGVGYLCYKFLPKGRTNHA